MICHPPPSSIPSDDDASSRVECDGSTALAPAESIVITVRFLKKVTSVVESMTTLADLPAFLVSSRAIQTSIAAIARLRAAWRREVRLIV
jgi:hypothetical protein